MGIEIVDKVDLAADKAAAAEDSASGETKTSE
jgi:hypothetical protein